MKRMITLVSFLCFCSGIISVSAHAQRPRPKTSATASEPKPAESPAPQTTADQPLRVRVDGLYYANVARDPGKPAYQYFRFYSDATGVGMCCTTGLPAEVSKWFNKDYERGQEGTYRLEGDSLIFIVGEEQGSHTKYSGTLSKTEWTLNPNGPNTIKFAFAPVNFPKEVVRPGQNRAPKISPVVSKLDAFDYDPAGRVIGVTTTIEIKASDPDGDPLTYVWTATVSTVVADGPKGVWKRPIVMGRPSGGVVTVVVTDGKGGKTSRDFTFY